MNAHSTIESRMENIKAIFQGGKNFASQSDSINVLTQYLEKKDPEFRSVAYEGASMALALKDLTNNNSLKLWKELLGVSQNHAGQIHIGLGWAIGEARPQDLFFINSIDPKIEFRVWDGCGYYDGIFRQRQTIKNQTRQEYIHEKDYKAYDEGVGRSVWYNCKGDPIKVLAMIQAFPSSRQADLWRGVGIACTYVGGSDESVLKELFTLAEKYSVQLSIGAAMVAKSRTLANSITKDVELACNTWCNLSTQEAMQLTIKTESVDNSFAAWLLLMEFEIVNSTIHNK